MTHCVCKVARAAEVPLQQDGGAPVPVRRLRDLAVSSADARRPDAANRSAADGLRVTYTPSLQQPRPAFPRFGGHGGVSSRPTNALRGPPFVSVPGFQGGGVSPSRVGVATPRVSVRVSMEYRRWAEPVRFSFRYSIPALIFPDYCDMRTNSP